MVSRKPESDLAPQLHMALHVCKDVCSLLQIVLSPSEVVLAPGLSSPKQEIEFFLASLGGGVCVFLSC